MRQQMENFFDQKKIVFDSMENATRFGVGNCLVADWFASLDVYTNWI